MVAVENMKFVILLALTFCLFGVATAGVVDDLRIAIRSGETTEAIIELPQIVDDVVASPNIKSLSGDAKVSALVSALQDATTSAQAPFISVAHSLGLITESFWGSNIILVKGLTEKTLDKLGSTPGNFIIRPQYSASIHPTIIHHGGINVTQGPQWGVVQIRAPEAWAVTQGEGCIAGVIDTGVNLGHIALSEGFGGAWLDPYYSTAEPTDQHGHGSHCTGTIAGRANGVGVAPGAKWIACRGLNNQGSGTEANLIRCGEFMLTANPRPNVVSNSWGGGQGGTWYNPIITAWRNVNIAGVFALGDGPSCRTANSPGDQPAAIGVGATGPNDVMSSFSARGTTTTGLRKPEVVAPGSNIVSCGTGTNNYATMSGTSMASPHIAGALCLILSQNPEWSVSQVLTRLSETAAHPTLTSADRNCGLPGSGDFPNNAFGDGRIDVGRAVGV